MNTATTVDAYLAQFTGDVHARLVQMRDIITSEAPQAVESIAYDMPAYKLNGKPLVYFAGYAQHVGFYATPTGHEAFAAELAKYKQGKGSVQFPNTQPLPVELIRKMVQYRRDSLLNGKD